MWAGRRPWSTATNQLARPEKADILEKLSRPVTFDPAYQPFGDGHSAEKIVSEIRKFLQ